MRRDDRSYAVGGRIYSSTDFLYYNKSSDKSNFKSNVNSNNISNLKFFNKNNGVGYYMYLKQNRSRLILD